MKYGFSPVVFNLIMAVLSLENQLMNSLLKYTRIKLNYSIRYSSIVINFLFISLTCSCYAQGVSKLDTIETTNIDPYKCVCYQEIERNGRTTYMSTGFMIRRNIILTAGHNVFSNAFSQVTNIKIFPGRYKESYPYDSIEISSKSSCRKAINVHPSYRFLKKDRIKYDFAIIIIPESILSKATQWPSSACFEIDGNYDLSKGDKINVAGFPASHGYDGSLMTYQNQTCETIYDMTFAHDFDTQTGNSGSPIWVEKNGRKIAVGVHTFGEAGTKLTREDIGMIEKWIATNTN